MGNGKQNICDQNRKSLILQIRKNIFGKITDAYRVSVILAVTIWPRGLLVLLNYTKFIYAVEYQINENNGTFRRDIGDGSRPQYLVVTNRTGEWKIESVTVQK